jgi:hypothetical protein
MQKWLIYNLRAGLKQEMDIHMSNSAKLPKSSTAGVAAAQLRVGRARQVVSSDCAILFASLLRPPSPSHRLHPTSRSTRLGAHTDSASWRPFRTKWPSTSPGQTRFNLRSRRNHSHTAQLSHPVRNPYKAAVRYLQQACRERFQAPMLRLVHLSTLSGHSP